MKFPKLPIEFNITEQTVKVEFVIDHTGRLKDIKILNNCHHLFSDEVVRVLQMSPKWMPAYQNGRNVNIRLSAFFHFKLN